MGCQASIPSLSPPVRPMPWQADTLGKGARTLQPPQTWWTLAHTSIQTVQRGGRSPRRIIKQTPSPCVKMESLQSANSGHSHGGVWQLCLLANLDLFQSFHLSLGRTNGVYSQELQGSRVRHVPFPTHLCQGLCVVPVSALPWSFLECL